MQGSINCLSFAKKMGSHKQFWLLCFSSLFFMASFNMIIPELPSFITSLGGEAYKGWIIGMFALAALLSRPFSGRLSDVWGRIPVMIIGASVAALSGFMYIFIGGLWAFFILRFMHGFSAGFNPTGTTAYLSDISPAQRRGEWMGYLGVAGSAGMAGGPALGSFIASVYSQEAMFYTASFLALLSLAFVVGMKETVKRERPIRPVDLWVKPNEIFDVDVWRPSLVMFLSVFCFGIVLTVTPDLGDLLEVQNRGLFFTVMLSFSILVRVFAGKTSDRMGRVAALRVAMCLLVAAMSVLTFTHNLVGYYSGALLYGLAAGISSPAIFAWTIDIARPQFRGKAISTMFIALEAGVFSGSVLGGFIYGNSIHQIHYAYLTGIFTAALALVLLLQTSNKKGSTIGLP